MTDERRIRPAGIRQVAAAAGVSESTVSNVLNRPEVVAVETRDRVERAMEAVGFVRNRAAGQLRGATSSVVGVVVLDAGNIFFAEVARGVEDELASAGCLHMLCSSDARVDRERRYLRMFEEHGVRAMVVNPVNQDMAPLIEIEQRGTPVVLLDHPRGTAPLCAVTVDNVLGGRVAAEHLLELGHRRIAFLRSATMVSTIRQRREGAMLACTLAGLPAGTITDVVVSPHSAAIGDPALVRRILDLPVTAVLCFNDAAALGLLRELRSAGVRVPEQMSLVGYDDVYFAAELDPPLTTVRQPSYELGREAARLVLAESDPQHRHGESVFAPQLVVRASTAAPAQTRP